MKEFLPQEFPFMESRRVLILNILIHTSQETHKKPPSLLRDDSESRIHTSPASILSFHKPASLQHRHHPWFRTSQQRSNVMNSNRSHSRRKAPGARCIRCSRAKKGPCTGGKPSCDGCQAKNLECVWEDEGESDAADTEQSTHHPQQ